MAPMRVSRRPFLAAAAAAALAPRFSFGAPVRDRNRRLKLGLASYSLRKFSLDRTLELCQEIEIGYINLKDVHLPMTDPPEALSAARKKLEAAGVTLMGGGTITLKNDPAQVRKAFEYAKDAGFPLMVVAPQAETPDMVGKTLDITEKMIQESASRSRSQHGPRTSSSRRPRT